MKLKNLLLFCGFLHIRPRLRMYLKKLLLFVGFLCPIRLDGHVRVELPVDGGFVSQISDLNN
jgi:hypothetical protein